MSFRKVVKKFVPSGLFPAIEPYGHLAEAVLFNIASGFPARHPDVLVTTASGIHAIPIAEHVIGMILVL